MLSLLTLYNLPRHSLTSLYLPSNYYYVISLRITTVASLSSSLAVRKMKLRPNSYVAQNTNLVLKQQVKT